MSGSNTTFENQLCCNPWCVKFPHVHFEIINPVWDVPGSSYNPTVDLPPSMMEEPANASGVATATETHARHSVGQHQTSQGPAPKGSGSGVRGSGPGRQTT